MRICCISGSRADYGGVKAVHDALIKRGAKSTFLEINHPIEAVFGCTENDVVVVLGDRSEILKAVASLYTAKMPIAHLSGGDITEGSQDDCMRHAITKLSHLHFPTNEDSAERIIQMGEEPWRVHIVGYPGVDNIDISHIPNHLPQKDYILVVWHPNTLISIDEAVKEAKILGQALKKSSIDKVIIGPNKDTGGYEISEFFKKWAEDNCEYYEDTLPRSQYLALLKNASALVGNSSSGFYEAPSLGTPVVNIGDRQKGRIIPSIMVSSSIDVDDIYESIGIALTNPTMHYLPEKNIYETGNAAAKIADIIMSIKNPKDLLLKKFYTI